MGRHELVAAVALLLVVARWGALGVIAIVDVVVEPSSMALGIGACASGRSGPRRGGGFSVVDSGAGGGGLGSRLLRHTLAEVRLPRHWILHKSGLGAQAFSLFTQTALAWSVPRPVGICAKRTLELSLRTASVDSQRAGVHSTHASARPTGAVRSPWTFGFSVIVGSHGSLSVDAGPSTSG